MLILAKKASRDWRSQPDTTPVEQILQLTIRYTTTVLRTVRLLLQYVRTTYSYSCEYHQLNPSTVTFALRGGRPVVDHALTEPTRYREGHQEPRRRRMHCRVPSLAARRSGGLREIRRRVYVGCSMRLKYSDIFIYSEVHIDTTVVRVLLCDNILSSCSSLRVLAAKNVVPVRMYHAVMYHTGTRYVQ